MNAFLRQQVACDNAIFSINLEGDKNNGKMQLRPGLVKSHLADSHGRLPRITKATTLRKRNRHHV